MSHLVACFQIALIAHVDGLLVRCFTLELSRLISSAGKLTWLVSNDSALGPSRRALKTLRDSPYKALSEGPKNAVLS